MGTKYRVDVADSARTPCGMNSIRYLGDNWSRAYGLYKQTPEGFDAWGKPNATYGVILSVWDESRRDYIVKCSKGLS